MAWRWLEPEDDAPCVVTLPKPELWSDEAAVTAWVCQRIDYGPSEDSELRHSDMNAQQIFEELECEAVAAAKNGDFFPLAKLLNGEIDSIFFVPEKTFHLGPEANALLAARVMNPRGGKRGKRGRPALTVEQRKQREAVKPVHAAAVEVRAIEKVFREFYPRERGRHERAVVIAAKRHGIKQRSITNYLRSKHRL
jgi:hypothetical protein